MAVSCYNCDYLLNILEECFVLSGGNPQWITHGLKVVDPRVARFAEINEVLAFVPWKLNSKHVEALLKNTDGLSWSFEQVLTAASVLCHYHSLACFCLGQGLSEDSENLTIELLQKRNNSQDDSGYLSSDADI